MNVICVDPRTDPAWLELSQRYPSSVFNSPQWLRVLGDTYDFRVQAYVLLDDEGQPQAGIPFCHISDIRGERIASLPFSDFSDPLVADRVQWEILAGKLLEQGCPVKVRPLHNPIPLQDPRFVLVKQARWHGIDLDKDMDLVWQGFHSGARRAIRKAERNGLVAYLAKSTADLRTFFEMHRGVRKHKYRMLAQPYAFFQNIWRHFVEEDQGTLMLVQQEGRILGGALFLEWQDTLYYKFNASMPGTLDLRPNDLVIWEGIRYAKAKGLTRFDFGLSDWDQEGLVRYKRKYATEEKAISFLRHTPADAQLCPSVEAVQELLPQLTQLLTDESVPDAVTEEAGALLYRYFA